MRFGYPSLRRASELPSLGLGPRGERRPPAGKRAVAGLMVAGSFQPSDGDRTA